MIGIAGTKVYETVDGFDGYRFRVGNRVSVTTSFQSNEAKDWWDERDAIEELNLLMGVDCDWNIDDVSRFSNRKLIEFSFVSKMFRMLRILSL